MNKAVLNNHDHPRTAGTIGYITLNGRFRFGSFWRRMKRLNRLMMYIATEPNTEMVIMVAVRPAA